MYQIKVKRDDLKTKMVANRESHRKIFEEALAGWKMAVTDALEQAVQDASEGKKYTTSINLPQPKDHTADYDRVIQMLEMTVDETMEISEVEFAQYVLDDWGWKKDFLANSSNYTDYK